MDETDLPAERAQTRQDPRFSQADVDQSRSRRDPVPSGEGTPPAFGVRMATTSGVNAATGLGSIRARRTFEALRTTPYRGRSGPLSVSFIEQPNCSRAELAFSINRRVGTAVVRNRLRRRLRAIAGEQVTSWPAGAYVVRSGPGGPGLSFDELKAATVRAVEQATSRRTRVSPMPGQDGRPTIR
jgi:ribonuclease P protein component